MFIEVKVSINSSVLLVRFTEKKRLIGHILCKSCLKADKFLFLTSKQQFDESLISFEQWVILKFTILAFL